MELFFWTTLDKYRNRFLKIAGLQDINFDPMVSRYFEQEHINNIKSSSDRIAHGTGTDTNTGRNTTSADNYDDTKNISYNTSISKADGTTQNISADTTDSANKTGNSTTESAAHNRVYSNTTQGDAAAQTAGETQTNNKTENNLVRESTTNNTAIQDSIARSATKSAPMNASGITSTTPGDTETKKLKSPHLGNLDFNYASAYGQNDAENLTTTEDKQTGKEKTTNTADNTTGTETTERRSYNDIREESERTGDERASAAAGLNYTSDTHHNYNDNTTTSATTNGTENAGHNVQQSKATTTGESENTNERSTESTENTKNTTENTDRIRYTGREGLTPQEALRQAERYLRDIGPAINYIIEKLEPCFFGVYDI